MFSSDSSTRAVNSIDCLEALDGIQDSIARRVILEDSTNEVTSIAAIGHSFSHDLILSHVVVVDLDLRLVDDASVVERNRVPYVPGLLFCREGFPILKAVGKLRHKFDILFVDACGINHYRFAGLASHVGVLLDVPTIGVTKHTLCGEYSDPGEPGSYCEVRFCNRTVGFALKTKKDTNPIFISPGHRVSLQGALTIVLRCLSGHKFPEPLQIARTKARAQKRAICGSN